MSDEIELTNEDEAILDKIAEEQDDTYVFGWGSRFAGQYRDASKPLTWLRGWDDCDRHEGNRT